MLKKAKAKIDRTRIEINNSTIMARYFNTLPCVTDKTTSQKISANIEELNSMINNLYLIDTYKNTAPKTEHILSKHMEHMPKLTICWDIKQV